MPGKAKAVRKVKGTKARARRARAQIATRTWSVRFDRTDTLGVHITTLLLRAHTIEDAILMGKAIMRDDGYDLRPPGSARDIDTARATLVQVKYEGELDN